VLYAVERHRERDDVSTAVWLMIVLVSGSAAQMPL